VRAFLTVRTARELSHYPVAGIDLNMGCLPQNLSQNVGGGLLRDPEKIKTILGELRGR